jgi:GNAT superfamily N-acetyltransferase
MIRLGPRSHGAALGLYRASEARFPLIGAVLLDAQDGVVYADDAVRPRCAYVEHAFGFAQVLGRPTAEFESALERYLLVDRRFTAPKIRLYTPWMPGFLADPRYDSLRSFRQRFILDPASLRGGAEPSGADSSSSSDREVVAVGESNVAAIERVFGVTRRFWRSTPDFARAAHAVVVMHRGQPASMCYAAAEADRQMEIDVLTRPEHQRLGLGALAVSNFARRCLERGLEPLWDCFANNTASVQLCRSIGFAPKSPPYPFYTITR